MLKIKTNNNFIDTDAGKPEVNKIVKRHFSGKRLPNKII